MNKYTSYIIIGIGIAAILSGVYWIFQKGELLDILPPFLIGIGLIASTRIKPRSEDSK